MKIKFKAWDKQTKDWLSLYTIGTSTSWLNRRCGIFRDFFNRHIELVQFTGLWDDYGNEIYEGNIVEVHDKDETKTPHISKVTITYNGVMIDAHPTHCQYDTVYKRRLEHYCDYGFGGKYSVSCRVIGDIHDNPELLEE